MKIKKIINMNRLIEEQEDYIYKNRTAKIRSLGISVKKYMPMEQKYGLANRLFNSLYSNGVFDYVNAMFLIPVICLEAYSDEIEFPEDVEELDATGIYDMLMVSGAMKQIEKVIGSELEEINNIIEALIKVNNRQIDVKNPINELLSMASETTTEDISEIKEQAEDLMKDENIKKMLEFQKEADA